MIGDRRAREVKNGRPKGRDRREEERGREQNGKGRGEEKTKRGRIGRNGGKRGEKGETLQYAMKTINNRWQNGGCVQYLSDVTRRYLPRVPPKN